MSKGGYIDQDKVTAERRERKAAKARSAGKVKADREEKRFSLAREDRYERPVATLSSVNEVLPMAGNSAKGHEPLFSLFAAKPIQVSKSLVVEYLDAAPLYLVEGVCLTWIKHNWPSLLNVVRLMEPGDMHHERREVQNSERIWNTTLYVKRIA